MNVMAFSCSCISAKSAQESSKHVSRANKPYDLEPLAISKRNQFCNPSKKETCVA